MWRAYLPHFRFVSSLSTSETVLNIRERNAAQTVRIRAPIARPVMSRALELLRSLKPRMENRNVGRRHANLGAAVHLNAGMTSTM